jgi:transposase
VKLVPSLTEGEIVAMDNLSADKRPAVRSAIEAAGASIRVLSSYNRDLNPIKQVFAKLQSMRCGMHLVRSSGRVPTGVPQLRPTCW